MATPFVPYHPGTVQVTNGSKAIVGTGTNFLAYDPYDEIVVDGYSMLLDTITDATHATAKFNYLGGSGSGKAYEWVPQSDVTKALTLFQSLSAAWTSGIVLAFAGLAAAADKIAYFTGAGTMAVTGFTALARSLLAASDGAAMRGIIGAGVIDGNVGTTNFAVPKTNGSSGKLLQASGVTIDSQNNMTVPGRLTVTAAAAALLRLTNTGGGDCYLGPLNASTPFAVYETTVGIRLLSLDANGSINRFGGQIAFPATQNPSSDANTLDDYEEGTFTPVVYGSTTRGTATYGRQNGYYTKVGNNLSITIDVNFTGHTGTGVFNIDGLPFNPWSASLQTPFAIMGQGWTTALANYTLSCQLIGSGPFISILQAPVGGGNLTTLGMSATGLFRLNGWYPTA